MQLAILIILCVLFVALIISVIIVIKEIHKLRSSVIDTTAKLVSIVIEAIGKMTEEYVDTFNKTGEQHAEFTRKAIDNCNKNSKNTLELVTQSLKVLTDSTIEFGKSLQSLQNTISSKNNKKKEIKVE